VAAAVIAGQGGPKRPTLTSRNTLRWPATRAAGPLTVARPKRRI